jgi:hypothetical protein
VRDSINFVSSSASRAGVAVVKLVAHGSHEAYHVGTAVFACDMGMQIFPNPLNRSLCSREAKSAKQRGPAAAQRHTPCDPGGVDAVVVHNHMDHACLQITVQRSARPQKTRCPCAYPPSSSADQFARPRFRPGSVLHFILTSALALAAQVADNPNRSWAKRPFGALMAIKKKMPPSSTFVGEGAKFHGK